jgi:glycosyltransferase involved in cell wall biosynthesis
MTIKIVGMLQCHNEHQSGFLEPCLENLKRFCDDIVVVDDSSTDGSIEVIARYTTHCVSSVHSGSLNESQRKQEMLGLALTLNPDWLYTQDADERLDETSVSSIRNFLENTDADIVGVKEITLWESYNQERFDWRNRWKVKAFRNTGNLHFIKSFNIHTPLGTPQGFTEQIVLTDNLSVFHYGYSTPELINARRLREEMNEDLKIIREIQV